MAKNTKGKRGTITDLTQEMKDKIKVIAKAASAARQNFHKVCDREFRGLAEMLDYADIDEMVPFMIQAVMDNLEEYSSESSWEESITCYVSGQFLDWEQKRLEEVIRETEEKIKSIKEQRGKLDY